MIFFVDEYENLLFNRLATLINGNVRFPDHYFKQAITGDYCMLMIGY